jgi:DNA-directed RNA polymerase specialized sigma24 family protein
MEHGSDAGGDPRRFPPTRHSLVQAVRSDSPELRRRALEGLGASYWKPVYVYLRLKWRLTDEEAQDLTQGFFAQALQNGLFERYEPARSRLRTYLRVAIDAFAANEHKAANRLKRGGGVEFLSLDLQTTGNGTLPLDIPDGADPDRLFRREWVRALFERAVSDLRASCEAGGRGTRFAIFERHDLEAPDRGQSLNYGDLAREFDLPRTQITNHLAWARREFRRRVLELIRESTSDDEEFRAEAREILGVDPL